MSRHYQTEVVDLGDEAPVPTGACPVCGGRFAVAEMRVVSPASTLWACTDCGLGRLEPRSRTTAGTYYPESYYGADGRKFGASIETVVRWGGRLWARYLTRDLTPGARVLDVGCGRGVLLDAFLDLGLEAHGTEIDPAAAGGVDPRVELRFVTDLREAGYPSESLELIVLWHVLEHLPDPRASLLEVHRLLQPGGRLAVTVPNFSSLQARWAGAAWFHLDLPRHLFHFPVSALRRLLRESGFRIAGEHHFSLAQNPFGWVQSGLNRLTWLERNALYEILHVGDPGIELPFRHRVFLRLVWIFGMPLGLLLSLIAAAIGRGATVTLIAEKESPNPR